MKFKYLIRLSDTLSVSITRKFVDIFQILKANLVEAAENMDIETKAEER